MIILTVLGRALPAMLLFRYRHCLYYDWQENSGLLQNSVLQQPGKNKFLPKILTR